MEPKDANDLDLVSLSAIGNHVSVSAGQDAAQPTLANPLSYAREVREDADGGANIGQDMVDRVGRLFKIECFNRIQIGECTPPIADLHQATP
nr:hypothetical protein [Altererythrobacter sp. Root672]